VSPGKVVDAFEIGREGKGLRRRQRKFAVSVIGPFTVTARGLALLATVPVKPEN